MENDQKIEEIVEQFESQVDRLIKLIRFVTVKMEQELIKEGILARVSARVKSSDSLRSKLRNWADDPNKVNRLNGSSNEVLSMVSDLAAARVMTYTENDRDAVVQIAQRVFRGPVIGQNPFELEKKEDDSRIKSNDRNHYRATHMMIAVHENDLKVGFTNLKHDKCELQITSLLAHVWNEIEHDTIYKKLSGDLSDLEHNAIDSLGLLLKTGDKIIKSLLSARELREDQEEKFSIKENARFSNSEALSGFLNDHYGKYINGRQFDLNSGASELLELLRALKWDHPHNVTDFFSAKVLIMARKETVKLKKFLEDQSRTRPSLALDSCDVFTVGLIMKKKADIERWVTLTGRHRNNREVAIFSAYLDKSKASSPNL